MLDNLPHSHFIFVKRHIVLRWHCALLQAYIYIHIWIEKNDLTRKHQLCRGNNVPEIGHVSQPFMYMSLATCAYAYILAMNFRWLL